MGYNKQVHKSVLLILGKLMDLIGRKKSLILSNVVSIVGWTIIAAASSVSVICVGRFISGLAAASIALAGECGMKKVIAKNL